MPGGGSPPPAYRASATSPTGRLPIGCQEGCRRCPAEGPEGLATAGRTSGTPQRSRPPAARLSWSPGTTIRPDTSVGEIRVTNGTSRERSIGASFRPASRPRRSWWPALPRRRSIPREPSGPGRQRRRCARLSRQRWRPETAAAPADGALRSPGRSVVGPETRSAGGGPAPLGSCCARPTGGTPRSTGGGRGGQTREQDGAGAPPCSSSRTPEPAPGGPASSCCSTSYWIFALLSAAMAAVAMVTPG